MEKILSLVRRCAEDYEMLAPGDRVAVGVSGGPRSCRAACKAPRRIFAHMEQGFFSFLISKMMWLISLFTRWKGTPVLYYNTVERVCQRLF